ncbi:5-methylthioadenosine/S-adenosylhomocysteine deaminase [Brevibacillus reuszeri]|uniref:5-methylthioadenosine/S-adenosylhomocysteine deaminase n=1 Tax=Brevibacillus reuszeri TaxID=54915 RepID=A0A0K9YYJ9_9BACL|nr:amidohydrolase [Brevibacillus reuszeri]KNB73310.1 N-ethylammeline chlorohydrolase [Brevibacillus reuszeri]MED1856929.1 amidohydrolase [Brevibacillus reuszeri]GED68322.1 5-methylthioadenosine/S-adenosylhomocysteine deaminase [Brevibacillus reuszeri]
MQRILIKGCSILTMKTGEKPFVGDILLAGQRIARIAPSIDETADQILDGKGMLAMPGLINAHNHASMSLLRAFSDDLKLMDWLDKKMLPAEARMTKEDIYWGTMLGSAEMIASGTTAFADMYVHMDAVAEAILDSGMRASLTRGLVFLEDDGGRRMTEAMDLIDNYSGAGDGRITTMLGPHAPYTCPPEPLAKVVQLARERRIPIHIHLAETREEIENIKTKYNQTPTEYLHEIGLFQDNHVLLAHAVHLTSSDIQLLHGMKGGVSHNPVSNLKLACGIAPVTEMIANGITVGLGTDGAGSATTLDMFAEIKAATWLQKLGHGDPTVLPAEQALRMATIESAKLLGIDHEVGTLEAGKRADLILLDLNKPHLQPIHDLHALAAYSVTGADVDTTIVNGQILMRHRQLLTMSWEEVHTQSAKRAARLVEGL